MSHSVTDSNEFVKLLYSLSWAKKSAPTKNPYLIDKYQWTYLDRLGDSDLDLDLERDLDCDKDLDREGLCLERTGGGDLEIQTKTEKCVWNMNVVLWRYVGIPVWQAQEMKMTSMQ